MIARLFDPAGWLAPIVVVAKIIMQELWLLKMSWDDWIPCEMEARFEQFLSGYEEASDLRIPRWLKTSSGAQIEVHGFCDASDKPDAQACPPTMVDPARKGRCEIGYPPVQDVRGS